MADCPPCTEGKAGVDCGCDWYHELAQERCTRQQAGAARSHRRECGCWSWVLNCVHIDGQWKIALMDRAGGGYDLVVQPGQGLGRERKFKELAEAEAEFRRREALLLGREA